MDMSAPGRVNIWVLTRGLCLGHCCCPQKTHGTAEEPSESYVHNGRVAFKAVCASGDMMSDTNTYKMMTIYILKSSCISSSAGNGLYDLM